MKEQSLTAIRKGQNILRPHPISNGIYPVRGRAGFHAVIVWDSDESRYNRNMETRTTATISLEIFL